MDSTKDNNKKEINKNKKKRDNWVVTVIIITFTIALVLGFSSEILSKKLSLFPALLILMAIIMIGIVFDVIGLSIATADAKIFHAMAAKKVKGAKQALKLLKNVEKFTNVCNDVVGDIAGIVSGATGGSIGVMILNMIKIEGVTLEVFFLSLVSALIAALTVGGKAFGKKIAINNANDIVFTVAKILHFFGFGKK